MMLAARWARVAAWGVGKGFALQASTQQANSGSKRLCVVRSKSVGG
jgi:hypothetical protein